MAAGSTAPDREGASSLVELVYERTRRAILEGRYPPGQRLRLQDLADDSDVSLIPVREAVRLLEAGRLVELIPNKGARVALLSESDMADAYEARILVEGEAVRRAASQMTKDELTEVSESFDDMVSAFEAGEVTTASELHRAFHFALYQAARSPWLLHIIEPLWATTERYRRLTTPARPARLHLSEVRTQHLNVLEAIKAGDPDRAQAALQHHLRDTADRYKGAVAARDG